MKVVKPIKIPVLSRVVEQAGRAQLHVATLIGFPLRKPRALLDEMGFWAAVRSALGEGGVIDEGTAKATGEVLAAGGCFAPGGQPITHGYARIKVGAVDKRVAVLGNRTWNRGAPSAPEPFSHMPLGWAQAYGGPNYPKNPWGKGFEPVDHDGRKLHPLPNVEHYGALIRSPDERPEPAGLGAFDVSFAQRRARAGTYDKAWLDKHFPGLPPDAEPSFFNLAAEDQWLKGGAFRGDEEILVENMHPSEPRLEGRLPGLATRAFVTQRGPSGEAWLEIAQRCDTVWLFPESEVGVAIFHGTLPVADDDAADVVHLVIGCEEPDAPRSPDHYRSCLAKRLDKDDAAVAALSDSDLMPRRESGVAPNFDAGEVGTWLAPEGLIHQHGRRGFDRKRERAAERAKQLGLGGLPPMPPAPPLPPVEVPDPRDLDQVAAHIAATQALGAQMAEQARVNKARKLEQARQQAHAQDRDYDEDMAAAASKACGPPRPPSARMAELEGFVGELRRAGRPNLEIEAELAKPQFRTRIAELDVRALDGYRQAAHLSEALPRKSPDELAALRALVQAAIDGGESLAGRDLTGASLSRMSLRGCDLTGVFLEGADLAGCDLSGAKLARAVLAKTDLRGARLEGADLAGANLGRAELGDADLSGARLGEAIFGWSKLVRTRLCRADLAGAQWLETHFEAVDLSGAALAGCTFLKADFRGCRFAGADLSRATFVECRLDGASFEGANLTKATLVGCKGEGVSFAGAKLPGATILSSSELPRASFAGADLEKACLRTTPLAGACFDGATLIGADLSECDVSGGSFERARLDGALLIRTRLSKASLRGASLMNALASKARIDGADFTGANLFQADLGRALGDDKTSFAEAEVARVKMQPRATSGKGGAP